jgi:hypothetical protein
MPLGSGRLEKRVLLAVPVEISSPGNPSGAERTTTDNVSSMGVRILTLRPKEPHEQLMIRSLPGDLRTLARVVYCERLTDGRYGVGLQFQAVSVGWAKESMSRAAK